MVCDHLAYGQFVTVAGVLAYVGKKERKGKELYLSVKSF